MAKLTGPLFSLSASGKLAKTLVYADWKGIDYVRQYVTPANPNSASQQVQRGYMATAVQIYHSTVNVLNALDFENLNRKAGISPTPMSGFNDWVKSLVNTLVASVSLVNLHNTQEGAPGGGGIEIIGDSGVSTISVKIKYGTTPRALTTTQDRDEAAVAGGVHTFTLAGLTVGATYYYKIFCSTANSEENLGIGTFLAA